MTPYDPTQDPSILQRMKQSQESAIARGFVPAVWRIGMDFEVAMLNSVQEIGVTFDHSSEGLPIETLVGEERSTYGALYDKDGFCLDQLQVGLSDGVS